MLTVVIPVGSYHEAVAEEAIVSCLAQTFPVLVVVIYDCDRHGAGWARNRGLEQVETPFASFLDADDVLEPTFAEDTLRAYDGRHYVYTDWLTDKVIDAPLRPWSGNGEAHIVTTLLPTIAVRRIGGFDEDLPGGEDTDFYWKLTRHGLCGKRLNKPLVQYRKGGTRAHTFIHSSTYQTIMRGVMARYEGLAMACTDCGGNELDINRDFIIGEQQPGDVLAEALWKGERPERGPVTRRIYRGGWNSKMWVAPQDIDSAPHLFARVIDLPPALDEDDFQQFANQVRARFSGVTPRQEPPKPFSVPMQDAVQIKPDVGQVLRLYAPKS